MKTFQTEPETLSNKGSVTVFVTFVFLLLLSFLGALLETTRIATAQTAGNRDLLLAENEILTHYFLPLYQDYHVFGVYLEEGEMCQIAEDALIIAAGSEREEAGMDLLSRIPDAVTVEKALPISYEGEAGFQSQMKAYTKFAAIKELLFQEQENTTQVEAMEEGAKQMEEEEEEDRQSRAICRILLSFLESTEGIQTDEDGIKRKGKNKVKTVTPFAKELLTGDGSDVEAGISNSMVWNSLEGKYLSINQIAGNIAALGTEEDPEGLYQWAGEMTRRLSAIRESTRKSLTLIEELKEEKTRIAPDLYEKLGGMPKRVLSMEGQLQKNEEALGRMIASLGQGGGDFSQEFLAAAEGYRTDTLSFDYSSLVPGEESEKPWEALGKLLKDGYMGLVFPEIQELSHKKWEGVLEDGNRGWDIKKVAGLIGNFAESWEEIKGDLESKLLYDIYLQEHFGNYGTPPPKEGVLEYEREYILSGKGNDYDNLASITGNLILLRTLCSYMAEQKEEEKVAEAEAMAMAIVGITGLQPLITAVKHLILLVWAVEKALEETKALMVEGESLPLIPGILERAWNYENYLHFFQWIRPVEQITDRTMNLIQGNLRYRENREFDFNHCYVNLQMKAVWKLPHGFIALPFPENWIITSTEALSY